MKILIAAGGTGGHLYPAIALGHELKRRNHEFLFATKPNAASLKALEQEQFPTAEVNAAPLPAITANLKGLLESSRLIANFRPNCVVGFGSYAAVPVLLAGAWKKIPTVIHEQNVVPGRANSLCSIFAHRVAVSFPQTLKQFPKKSILVGNPVRKDLFHLDKPESLKALGLKESLSTILIFGGSGGARSINFAVHDLIEKIRDLHSAIQFIHLTGDAEMTRQLKERYKKFEFTSYVSDYSSGMQSCYGAADLVISRAGAGTVAELIATKRPAILIPYPFATGNHQTANALVLKDLGSALILNEKEGPAARLSEMIRNLTTFPERLKMMKEAYHEFPVKIEDAPNKLADLAENITK